jgi:hypothetical protein
MKPDRILIRIPTAAPVVPESAPTFRVDRPLKGLRVGLRTDPNWQSWLTIADDWSVRLRADGAEPVVLTVLDHSGEAGEQAKVALHAWADSIDCAVVGIGT